MYLCRGYFLVIYKYIEIGIIIIGKISWSY